MNIRPRGQTHSHGGALVRLCPDHGARGERRKFKPFQNGMRSEALFLDAAASHAAGGPASDRGGECVAGRLEGAREMPSDSASFPSAPGYCGWHLSGQKNCWRLRAPPTSGITINSSYRHGSP